MSQSDDRPLALVPDAQYIQRLFPKCPPIVNKQTTTTKSTANKRGKGSKQATKKNNANTTSKSNNDNNQSNGNPENPNSSQKKTRKQQTRRQREAKRNFSKLSNDNVVTTSTSTSSNCNDPIDLQLNNDSAANMDKNQTPSTNNLNRLTIKKRIDKHTIDSKINNNNNIISNKVTNNNNNINYQDEDSSDDDKNLQVHGESIGAGQVKLASHRRFERHKPNHNSRKRRSSNLLMPAIRETQPESDNNNVNGNNNDTTCNDNNNNTSVNDDGSMDVARQSLDDMIRDAGDDELLCNLLADDLDNKVSITTNSNRVQEDNQEARAEEQLVLVNDIDTRLSLVEVVQIETSNHDPGNNRNSHQVVDDNNNMSHQQPQSTMFRQHTIPNETSHFSLIAQADHAKEIISQSDSQQLVGVVSLVNQNIDQDISKQGDTNPSSDSYENLNENKNSGSLNDFGIDECSVLACVPESTDLATVPAVNASQIEQNSANDILTTTSLDNDDGNSPNNEYKDEPVESVTNVSPECALLTNESQDSLHSKETNQEVVNATISDPITNSSPILVSNVHDPSRSASNMNFNNLSDDLDSDYDQPRSANINALSTDNASSTGLSSRLNFRNAHNQHESRLVATHQQEEQTEHKVESSHTDQQLSSSAAIKVNDSGLFDGTNSETSNHGRERSNVGRNDRVNFDDVSPTPTIKTAFIFPRLDEGLSSNPDSGEDDNDEDDDDDCAMDADVDADEDDYDDEEEDEEEDDDDERPEDDDDVNDDDDDDADADDDDDILSHLQRANLTNNQQTGIDSLFRRNNQQQPKSVAQRNQSDNQQQTTFGSPFCNDIQQQQQQQSNLNDQNQLRLGQHHTGKTIGNYGSSASYSLDQHEFDASSELAKSLDTAYSNGANNSNYWQINSQQQQQSSPQSAFSRLTTNNTTNNTNSNNIGQTISNSSLASGLNQQNVGHRQLNNSISNGSSNSNRNKSSSANNSQNSYNRDEAKGVNRFESDTDDETDRLLGNQRSEQQFYKQQNSSNSQSISVNTNSSNNSSNSNSNNNNNANMVSPSVEPAMVGPRTSNNPTSSDLQIPPATNQSKSSNSREVLIEGVLFNVKYLGSTHSDTEGRSEKEDRIHQAEMAVHEVKYRNGDSQSAIEVQLFISTEKIMVLDDKNRKIMMDHSLRTISYIADIGNAIVLIVKKKSSSIGPSALDNDTGQSSTTNEVHPPISVGRTINKVSCHVFESQDSHTITKSISQAFQVAYTELLKANGSSDPNNYLSKELDYQDVLNSQEMSTDELEMFARKENQREVIVPKDKGEILGVSIVESGWGSILPTVVIASLKQNGPAERCKKLSIGDQILSVNGISLVGLPLTECQEIIKRAKNQRVARLSVVPCPITVEVKIKRPDTKYQLGFSVQNGVICSLLRGGIAERGGVRVGHRIMSINGTTVVGVPHEKIVTLLASSVGEIRMKTCLTSLYRLILGEDNPVHL